MNQHQKNLIRNEGYAAGIRAGLEAAANLVRERTDPIYDKVS